MIELVFILDESGSMYGLEKDTIGGFNSTIAKQKKEDGDCLVSTVCFSDKTQLFLIFSLSSYSHSCFRFL